MIIIPAIDLKEGKCVRLVQGNFGRSTVYSDNPVDIARKWQKKGASRIHVVDLDGSRAGLPQNMDIVRSIAAAVSVPVQVGGGIRSMVTVDEYIKAGIGYVILGTGALKDRDLVIGACQKYPGRVILGLDARDGNIAVEGWIKEEAVSPLAIAKSYENKGISAVIYTDIKRDGMETGVNIEATKSLAESVNLPVIASGGVADIQDIEKLKAEKNVGIIGVIVGKALYSGALDLSDAIKKAEEKTEVQPGRY